MRESGDTLKMLICDAIYICFNPDAIKSVCDAEEVLTVLFCFLNASTMIGTDEAVRKALLKNKITQLKEEISDDDNADDGKADALTSHAVEGAKSVAGKDSKDGQ